MIRPSTLSEAAFRELLAQAIKYEWGGTAEDREATVFGSHISTEAPGGLSGSWHFLPIPGWPQLMRAEELQKWAQNRILSALVDSLGADPVKFYQGPGIVLAPANAELASALNNRIADVAAALRRENELPERVQIRVLSPDALMDALSASAAMRRAFQAAFDVRDGSRSLAESPIENVARGARIAVGSSARQLRPFSHISLTQAGGASDEPARLASIFFDPIVERWPSASKSSPRNAMCAMVVNLLDVPLLAHSSDGRNVRVVLVGGPGQGKSTVLQFLAQLYRASFVGPEAGNSPDVRDACAETFERADEIGISPPQFRRWPIHVSLAHYAEHLAALRSSPVSGTGNVSDSTTREGLLAYIVSRVQSLDDSPTRAADIRAWLQEWPSVLLLDGMDETPPELRTLIREQIDDFEEVAFQLGADIAIVVTSRPQGSVTDFPFERWEHFSLAELDEASSKKYARAVISLHQDLDSEAQDDLASRIDNAITSAQTSRLARTPLQVTILVLLFQENLGAQSRYQLFDGYFTVIYRREANKPGALGEFIREHRPELEELHERAGFILHVRSEHGEDASLTNEELAQLLSGVLTLRGYGVDAVLVERLRLAIVDRLVLLVSPRQGSWHFEVRVLQEYMTARHWTSGQAFDTERLENILQRTLPLQFWRTVWSLTAGRILSDRIMYRQTLLTALSGADTTDSVAISTHPASRIAVDLLLDAAAANRPADTRALVKLALDAMQDLSLQSIAGLADVLSGMLLNDGPTDQILSDEVSRIGSAWSLERVALTALLRTLRVRVQRASVRSRIDGWLRTLGNQNDQTRLETIEREVTLEAILATVAPDLRSPTTSGSPQGRFELHSDVLGSGYVIESGEDVSAKIARLIGNDGTFAQWLAQAESQLRDSSPRLAKQLRDGLAYWSGLRPLGVVVDSVGNLTG